MTRLLHLHIGKEGGAERFFVNLARAFADDGIEQRFVIRPDRTWGDAVAALGPVHHTNYRPLGLWDRWRADRFVARTCRDWRPDAIMSWMPRASRAQPAGWNGMQLVRLGDYPANLKHFGACDLIVGNTPGIVARARDLGWDRGTAVISNFARPVAPRPVDRAALDTPADAPLLVTGGRFVPRKGMDVALRAAARIEGLHVWLVGDGRERGALEALAADLGIAGRVRFAGWVDEPIHHIAAGDVFLLPSRHEPLGNVLIEAWHAGVPSVSSACEGPSWFMRDGVDGLLVGIDDVDATAAALRRMLEDRAFAARCAAGARARLDEMFSVEAVVRAYRAVFDGTAAEARALR